MRLNILCKLPWNNNNNNNNKSNSVSVIDLGNKVSPLMFGSYQAEKNGEKIYFFSAVARGKNVFP